MSDEKRKPFAEVVLARHQDGEESPYAINVAGERLLTIGEVSEDDIDDIAAQLSRAVEAREARLRAVLKLVEWRGVAHDEPYSACPVCCVPNEFHPSNQKPHQPDCALAAALGPNPPAYVPKAELDAERTKVAQLQAAFDALDVREYGAGELVAKYLEASGLKRPEPETGSDEELLRRQMEADRERARRGANTPVQRRFDKLAQLSAYGYISPEEARERLGPTCPHCNDLPYDGTSLICPECGINRHGVGHGAG